MSEFDLSRVPLNGRTLIEANAGTGKTYAMVGLFIRLILERQLQPREIVVVTFTKAATAELKSRILNQLHHCRDILQGRAVHPDPVFLEICLRAKNQSNALVQLQQAIRTLDLAVIQTIHGFCQRLLLEFGHLAGMPASFDVIVDNRHLAQELLVRRWQEMMQGFSLGFLTYLSDSNRNMDETCAHALRFIDSIQVTVDTGEKALCQIDQLESQLIDQLLALQHDEAAMADRRISLPVNAWLHFGRFPKLGLLRKIPKKLTAAQDLKETAQALYVAYQHQYRIQVYCLAQNTVIELAEEKRRTGLKTYQDLLNDVHAVLQDPQRHQFLDVLQNRFPVALVDEFQDTDPIQFEIFNRLFSNQTQSLFLVGDPKQAIYGFRGADVFAYLNSRNRVDRQYKLFTNWRSTPELVTQVNKLFGHSPEAFLLPGLDYQHSNAAKDTLDNQDTGIKVWQLEDEKRADLPEFVCAQVAQKIAVRLTNGTDPSNIVVLVRDHRQAQIMLNALQQQLVPVSLFSSQSIFRTAQALELTHLIKALDQPESSSFLNAALCGQLFGLDAGQLYNMGSVEQSVWHQRFVSAAFVFDEYGPAAGLEHLLIDCKLIAPLLSSEQGHWVLSNWYQLMSWVQSRWVNENLERTQLIELLEHKIMADTEIQDDERLNAQAQSSVVRVMTMHASKGLQFPIVYCPFLWQGKAPKEDVYGRVYHDPEQDYASRIDLAMDTNLNAQSQCLLEKKADERRLLYVALTRAEHRCEIVIGLSSNCVFHQLLMSDTLSKNVGITDQSEMLSELDFEHDKLVAETQTETNLDKSGPQLPAPRKFKGRVPIQTVSNSFSSLAVVHDRGEVDLEMNLNYSEVQHEDALPGGAAMGNFVHDLMETLPDFNMNLSQISTHLEQAIPPQELSAQQLSRLVQMIHACLHTQLDSQAQSFNLSALKPHQYIREMPFQMKITNQGIHELVETVQLAAYQPNPQLDQEMNGFIDLVFERDGQYFLLDYKTNLLGNQLEDYRLDQLKKTIKTSAYDLQYLIYTLGLSRHLQQRLNDYDYERDFGGAYYLFMRGLNPDFGPKFGVFYAKPPVELIRRLMAELSS